MEILRWLFKPAATWREEQQKKIKADAESLVQVREWDGGLWLSFDGVPVAREEQLNTSLVEAVRECREAYIRHKEAQL